MESAGTERARALPSEATITVKGGCPNPPEVEVCPEATVQFVNEDSVAYRVRLWTRDGQWHADVDILLPARCGITVMVDPLTGTKGECYYELVSTTKYAEGAALAGSEPRPVMELDAATTTPLMATAATASNTSGTTSANANTGGGSGGGTIKIGGH